MTIPDLIDQELREIGASPESIEQARHFAMSLYCKTTDTKERVLRDLEETEIEHYRMMIRLYFLAVIVSPEFRDQLRKEIKNELGKN